MGSDRPFFGVQPLRGDYNPLVELSIEQTAALFLRDIKDIQDSGPYILIGYSMGGLIAFEMARQLAASGQPIAFLGLIDSMPPGPRREASWANRARIHFQNLHALPREDRFQYLRQHARRLIFRVSRFAARRRKLPTRRPIPRDRLDIARLAIDQYSPHGGYPNPVTIFRVTNRPWYIRWDPLTAWKTFIKGEWKTFIKGELTYVDIPGTHANVMEQPCVQELASRLKTCLDSSEAQESKVKQYKHKSGTPAASFTLHS